MPRKLWDSVVVITGASSGIGRATALEFADRGARLVLASRNKSALKEVAEECERRGTRTLTVRADVADESEVESLAEKAVDEFGRFDVWVNNAAVGLYGRFEDTPADSYRQVIETNLLGCINGARAAIRQFQRQGGGVLINVSSQVATGGMPFSSAYAVTKSGMRMFGDCLRQELLDSDIHVCTVLPASVDTPFFQHAANYSGREVKPLGSVHKAEEVAREIVRLAERPEREVLIGKMGHIMSLGHAVTPGLYDRIVRRKAERQHFTDERARNTDGALFKPKSPEAVEGGWRERQKGAGRGAMVAGVAVSTGVIAYLLSRQRRRAEPERAAA